MHSHSKIVFAHNTSRSTSAHHGCSSKKPQRQRGRSTSGQETRLAFPRQTPGTHASGRRVPHGSADRYGHAQRPCADRGNRSHFNVVGAWSQFTHAAFAVAVTCVCMLSFPDIFVSIIYASFLGSVDNTCAGTLRLNSGITRTFPLKLCQAIPRRCQPITPRTDDL